MPADQNSGGALAPTAITLTAPVSTSTDRIIRPVAGGEMSQAAFGERIAARIG